MDKQFIKAVGENELATVRMMLSNELLLDPRGASFSEMLKYANDKLADLFEEDEPMSLEVSADKSTWDNILLSKMKRELNSNFSKEKLAIFEEMAKHVGQNKADVLDDEEEKKEEEESVSRKKEIATGTIVTGGGAIIAITGLCIKGAMGTALSIVGGVLTIGGVILLSSTSKRK